MAMNKKELAEVDRLRSDLALARAMRWPSYAKPASMTHEEIKASLVDGGKRFGVTQRVARGWFYNAYLGSHSAHRVTYGCSDGLNHDSDGDTTSTQQMGRMYATKREALQALRLDLTETCAKVLAAVDRQIDEEEPA
jgi:hypothetical protein